MSGFERVKKVIAWGAITLMTGEVALIIMQASRGTTSHFNNSTAFDGTVFSAMGLMIIVNTFLLIYLRGRGVFYNPQTASLILQVDLPFLSA